MDGTTAGRLELARPAPRPTPPAGGGLLDADHTSSVQPASPTQPQFSQLTPVYAPTPTNTPADIPQPPVKGIEFIQASTPVPAPVQPPAPQPTAAPTVPPVIVDQPFKPQPSAALTPPTLEPAAPLAVAAPLSNTPPPIAPMPPMPPTSPQPFRPPEPTTPLRAPEEDLEPEADEPLSPRGPNYDSIATLEKHIDSVDLDQKVGTSMQEPEPASFSIPEPVPAVEPTTPAKVEEVRNYFQNTYSADGSAVPPSGGGGAPKFSLNNFSPKSIRRVIIIAVAVIVIGIGGFLIVNAVLNSQQKQDVAIDDTPITETPIVIEPNSEETPIVTPVDEQEKPTTPIFTPTPTPAPTPTPVASEGVPTVANSGLNDSDVAATPRYLRIAKLDINARVETIGVTSSGAMGVPTDMWNAGWYIGSAKPGQGGAVFMDGHSTANRGALFGNLDTLVAGDMLEIQRNDGAVIKYQVAKVSVVNRNDVDMAAMMLPYDLSKNGLNILSCTGQWIESEQTLENRVMVYAVQV